MKTDMIKRIEVAHFDVTFGVDCQQAGGGFERRSTIPFALTRACRKERDGARSLDEHLDVEPDETSPETERKLTPIRSYQGPSVVENELA
jgi:hypothetical protein